MQLLEPRTQGRNRTVIDRLDAMEPVAQFAEQLIASCDALVRLADKPLTLVGSTNTPRLQVREPLHEHIDRETTDLQVPGEIEHLDWHDVSPIQATLSFERRRLALFDRLLKGLSAVLGLNCALRAPHSVTAVASFEIFSLRFRVFGEAITSTAGTPSRVEVRRPMMRDARHGTFIAP
jgi:hypothetical protein